MKVTIRNPRRPVSEAALPFGPIAVHIKKETIKKELGRAYDILYALDIQLRKEGRALDSADAKSTDGHNDTWYGHRESIDNLEDELNNVISYLKNLNEYVRGLKG